MAVEIFNDCHRDCGNLDSLIPELRCGWTSEPMVKRSLRELATFFGEDR